MRGGERIKEIGKGAKTLNKTLGFIMIVQKGTGIK
jgi:hypothetical protein